VSFDRIGADGIELVAPGAVGIPLDGDHRAAWALMHDDGRIERRRVAYDHAASAARVREVADGGPWGEVVAGRIERAALA
jgi:diadenosine tetraphosphatase ApaH/serine/threonine PP2A family protein phosphatase